LETSVTPEIRIEKKRSRILIEQTRNLKLFKVKLLINNEKENGKREKKRSKVVKRT
jgi:hypothetical protein